MLFIALNFGALFAREYLSILHVFLEFRPRFTWIFEHFENHWRYHGNIRNTYLRQLSATVPHTLPFLLFCADIYQQYSTIDLIKAQTEIINIWISNCIWRFWLCNNGPCTRHQVLYCRAATNTRVGELAIKIRQKCVTSHKLSICMNS
jgi:hypothetical protein